MIYSIKYEKMSAEIEEYLTPASQRIFAEYGHAGGPDKCVPDFSLHYTLSEVNMGGFIVLRDEGGSIVGFISFFISPHFHYKGELFATTDTMWIEKEHRTLNLFRRMLRTAEATIYHHMGANYLNVAVNTSNPMGNVIKRMGFELADHTFTKRLGE